MSRRNLLVRVCERLKFCRVIRLEVVLVVVVVEDEEKRRDAT